MIARVLKASCGAMGVRLTRRTPNTVPNKSRARLLGKSGGNGAREICSWLSPPQVRHRPCGAKKALERGDRVLTSAIWEWGHSTICVSTAAQAVFPSEATFAIRHIFEFKRT